MKCRSCGTPLRFSDTPPGTYLLIGAAAFGIAVLAALWRFASNDAGALPLVIACTAAGAAVLCGAAVWTALIDNRSMGSKGEALDGRRCAHCDHVTPLRPWSR